MDSNINILILSSGTRNKIVQYFKNELNGKGKVFTTDASKLAPALYDSDGHFIVPRIDQPGYLDEILSICEQHDITGVLSLIDPELSIISKHKDKFLEIGTTPIVSDYEVIEMCFDKFKFNSFLKEKGFNSIKSYLKLENFYQDLEDNEITFPVFVKPVKGSASLNINKVYNKEELEILIEQHDDLMIQEFMDGTEYGIDVYIDMISEKPVSIFAKEKILMKAGETDKSRSIKDDKLFELVQRFVKKAGFVGIIDIDIFKVEGEFYISEVNPRFGGGYPHGYEIGINIPEQIIENLKGKEAKNYMMDYPENNYMMKYNEVKIFTFTD